MGARPRERRTRLLFVVPLGFALVLLPGVASSAEGPTIEAAGGGPYYWSPTSAEVAPGGTVNFKSPGASEPHGVKWTSGPQTPSCVGVPIDDFKTSWSGGCTFAQVGTYRFVCTVHPEMTGTITASAIATTPTNPPPPPGGSPQSPVDGPALEALTIAKNQHGNRVRGFIDLSQAGGRLKADLLATRASLFGAGRKGTMRVGRLVRSSLGAGRVQFAISLDRIARQALQLDHRLQLTVKLVITPSRGDVVKRTRGVVLHG